MRVTRARRRQTSQPRWGGPFTVVSYFCAFLAALLLCGVIGPGRMWRRTGLQKEYRPYLVLELPVAREEIARGPLAGDGEEIPAPHREQMEKRKLSREEYVRWLRAYPWEGDHLTVRQDGVKYEVYFIPAGEGTTRVPVPVGYVYILSGDGEDGFIVTVWIP